MSAKSKAFENDWLKLIFHGVTIPGLAQNVTVGALTHLYLALHTADPGENGNQSTSEISYTGYVRVAVERSTTAWILVQDNEVRLMENQNFPQAPASGVTNQTVTFWSVGTDATGTGKVLYRSALSPQILISNDVIPRLTTGTGVREL